jgi:hypothetical protein
MWLIQDGVMLSIMPGMRLKGQLRDNVIPTLTVAFALSVASFLHPSV